MVVEDIIVAGDTMVVVTVVTVDMVTTVTEDMATMALHVHVDVARWPNVKEDFEIEVLPVLGERPAGS